MKALDIAMQMAREVLETLQAPVNEQSFDLKCVTQGSGISCVLRSEGQNQSLALSLKVEVSHPKNLSQCSPQGRHLGSFDRKSPRQHVEDRKSSCVSPGRRKPRSPQRHKRENGLSPQSFSPVPRPRPRSDTSHHSSTADSGAPDVIIEELLDEEQGHAPPPTGPELAHDKWRIHRRKNDKRNVTHWVVVSHVVNPGHFYVQYMAEKRESEILSKKINQLCCKDCSCFTSSDTVESGSIIFVKKAEGVWCRASVVEVSQKGSEEAVRVCPVTQLASIRLFLQDYGLIKTLTMKSEVNTKGSLNVVNSDLRKVSEAVKVELHHFAPQAVRCSLKDLVPYDLTKGWSLESQVEFRNVVGSAAVEMRPLGQDRDSLLVDLKKAPMDQSADVSFSIRQYLVFIEVARFYSPVLLDRKPLMYYPPVHPKINRELNAVVSHINNPADFYIQLVDNMESVLLSASLQDIYNAETAAGGEDLHVYCPEKEQAYVARYDDEQWYRAQVIGYPGDRKVEVRYVDFGNKKTLSVSDLRKIKDEFFALPAMAIHCCLSDVVPLDGEVWSEACSNRFISLTHQKLVTIVATGKVPKMKPLPVRLFESGLDGPLADIAELLVKEELASFKDRPKSEEVSSTLDDSVIWDPPLDPGSAPEAKDDRDQKSPGEQNEELLELMPQLKLPAELKDLKVRVSHVNSPSSFYVQLTQYNSQLKRVCELVKQECAQMKPDEDEVWKADMYCGAYINGVWERGQICSDVTSSDYAEVRRCDHGNTMKLHVSNLRLLPSSLSGSLALECTLTDIRPAGGRSTWTATACDLISYYLSGASAVMTIKELTDERPVPVTLLCSNEMGQFVSVADFLTSEGLALRERKPRDAVVEKPEETDAQSPVSGAPTDGHRRTTPSSSPLPPTFGPPKPAPRTLITAEKVKTQLYQPPELPCLGQIPMCVSAIGEDGLIYSRTQNAECQLEQLRQRIHQSMKTLPRQKPYTWKSVLGCAVIGPDMLWYRGQLLEVLGGDVKVQYVDSGLVETIPVVHVYPMLLCPDVPQLCMPCQLHNINPVGGRWQRDAVSLLRGLMLNRCVDIRIVELPTDPRGALTVEIFLDGLSLNKILCHHQHASVDNTASAQMDFVMPPASFLDDWDLDTEDLKGPEEPILGPFIYPNLPEEGERFQVRVKHLWTPNELFLWPLGGTDDVRVNGETLDEALTKINKTINDLPRLSNFPPGGPCLAEYSDGQYYRAKLIRFTSIEPLKILVRHVDFGSDDTLPPSKLHQMPPELLEFPCQALKVKVAGFKSPSKNRREDMLPYSPGWSVKATMDMVSLLHGKITAVVVAQKPELTVLLYNEDEELVHLPLVSSGLAELE